MFSFFTQVIICFPYDGLSISTIVRTFNEVNPNGETYPVGVFISNYAASFAAQYLGAALIEVRKR